MEDKDIAWHCGAKAYKHPACRNANSIGIELCVRNTGSKADTSRDWYFEDATVAAAIELTKALMDKCGIDADHVLRHYDVTGKICPNPYVYNHTRHTWNSFRAALAKTNPVVHSEGFMPAADGNRWWYQYKDGSFAKSGWFWLTEETTGTSAWYLFDDKGCMLTGYQKAPDARGALKIVGKYDFQKHEYIYNS